MRDFVAAIDQGTTSTRFMVFDHDGNQIAKHRLERGMVVVRTAHNHERLTISAGARSAERAHRQLVPFVARGERLIICTDLNHGHLPDLLSPDAHPRGTAAGGDRVR